MNDASPFLTSPLVRRRWLAVTLSTILAGQWTSARAQQAEIEDADWHKLNPLAQRVDEAQLAIMTQHLQLEHPMVSSLLMVRNGQPVYEYYGENIQAQSLHNVYSVTKSVVALLVGRAIDQGLISSTQEKLIDLLPAKQGSVGDIKLDQLLNMSAGFDPGNVSRDGDYLDFMSRFYAPGLQAHALARSVRTRPGEQFYYNNLDAHLVSLALSARVSSSVATYAEVQLFKPLSIKNYDWAADLNGNVNGASELRLRARDMAKIGQLVLQGGQWRGQQLISSAFVQAATQRRIDTNIMSGDLARPLGYGYLWWVSAAQDNKPSAYFAIGFGGQYIYIVPALQLVVVATTRASSRASAARTAAVIRNFALPAVL